MADADAPAIISVSYPFCGTGPPGEATTRRGLPLSAKHVFNTRGDNGAPDRFRTCNNPVNSRVLYR